MSKFTLISGEISILRSLKIVFFFSFRGQLNGFVSDQLNKSHHIFTFMSLCIHLKSFPVFSAPLGGEYNKRYYGIRTMLQGKPNIFLSILWKTDRFLCRRILIENKHFYNSIWQREEFISHKTSMTMHTVHCRYLKSGRFALSQLLNPQTVNNIVKYPTIKWDEWQKECYKNSCSIKPRFIYIYWT